jgi:photosystem II stability/assembly factor-like uncharacterized protein
VKPREYVLALGLAMMLASAARAQEGPEHARRRWEYFYNQRAFPFGEIAPGALERARAQLVSGRVSFRANAVQPIAGTQWTPIGPTLIGTSAIGRISTIALHPVDPETFYIGGAQGGVWKTTNGGTTWTPLTDRECSLAMGSIAIDPVNPEIVYAATGEQHFSGDSYYGCGVLRSTDGGTSWSRLGATTFVRSRISRLLIVPSTAGAPATTMLLVASDNGLWRSSDGGGTWVQLRTGVATDLVLDPTNEQIVYVAIRGQGVFRSVNGGDSWSGLGAGFPTASVSRINIAIAPSSPSTLLAAIQSSADNRLLGVYRTTDGAATWTQLPATGASCSTQCWYDLFVAIHPTDASTVFFGGVALYRSTNGAESFTNVTTNIHVDQHNFTFDPRNPQRVFVVNDGGVYRSDNGGSSWTSLNNGLAVTQFYAGISLHPSDPSIVLGGTQDNGTLQYSGLPNWAAVIGGDGGYTAIDYENPQIRFGETQWTANSTFGGPRRSDGGGFVRKVSGINTADPAQFIPPLVMDRTSPRTLYFGTNRVYRTVDAAETWTPISPAFTGTVSAIAPAPSEPAVVYVGTSGGQLQVTSGGETWTLRTTGLPSRFITDIAVDRADANTAYVTVSGFGTGHVFRTVNRGVTWTNASGNLPDMPVNAVSLDPVSRRFVMIGTDLGVFVSADSGATWAVLDDGMPNVAVFDIAYNPTTGTLIAATHGRGMFSLQLNRSLTLAAVPNRRRADVVETSTTPHPDSAAVVLSGAGAGTAAWTASNTGAPWVTFITAAGTGSGRVRWTRNPTGLTPGYYVDTITVTAAGAIDSPAMVIDTLFVEPVSPVLDVTPAAHGTTASAGSPTAAADSALVTLGGSTGGQVAWTAVPQRGTWIAMTTASGVGTGRVRWTRAPTGLPVGVHHDTIVVTAPGATGSPALIVDSLVINPALLLSPAGRRDELVSGSPTEVTATAQLTILGDATGTIAWSASHGTAPWLTLNTTAGQGGATLSWTKSAMNLRDAVYVDTITITAPNAATLRVVDTLVVVAPAVTRACVTDHLLGAPCLDATQLRWLDLAGNRDGVYNLGDLLAYLARPGVARSNIRGRDE